MGKKGIPSHILFFGGIIFKNTYVIPIYIGILERKVGDFD